MKSLRQLVGGYTIIELMIVLVVGSAIFTLAIVSYNQQNTRTQFSRAVWDFESTLQDLLNDVGTGYYPNRGNFECSAAASGPDIQPAAQAQGKNQDCIFLGRAVDLTDTSDLTYEIHTIVGLRNGADGKPVRSFDVNRNRAIRDIEGAVETKTLHGSMNIVKIVVGDGNDIAPIEREGFAIITGFGSGSAVSGSGATTNQVKIVSLNNNSYTNSNAPVVRNTNLNENVLTICIEEFGGGGDAQHASITIGKRGSLIDLDTKIVTWNDWAVGCK